MGSMDVSYRLNVSGSAPARRSLLPELPGSATYEPGTLDRMGEQLQSSWPLVAAGSVAGGVIGSKLLRIGGGGIFRGIVGGIAGVLGGAAIGMSGLALLRGAGEHRTPDAPKGATVAETGVAEREQVKVMTYNLHGGMGGPGKFGSSSEELDELAEVIRREQPDILMLQEVDRFATRSNYVDVLAELDERLGADSAVGATALTQVTGRNQDVAVMTFNGFTVSDARNIVHPDPRGNGFDMRVSSIWSDAKTAISGLSGTDWNTGSRNATRNTIDTIVTTPEGTNVRVLSGHYERQSQEVNHQERQVGVIAGALDAWQGPTIWGADFNVKTRGRWGDSERELMQGAGMRDTFDGVPEDARIPIAERSTSPRASSSPAGGIDRIYASKHAEVLDARVVREAGMASDHLPVVAELELVPNGR